MNGIGLLVMLAIGGQVGTERDFGWQIASDGVLEYIVQVSPQAAAKMQLEHKENISDIPPELVGRARRVTFRIGDSVLPRTPSIEEIKRIPRYSSPADVAATLGPGRISDVESDAVVNVQNSPPGLPALPKNLDRLSSGAKQLGGNLIDQAGQMARRGADAVGSAAQGSLADKFLDQTGRQARQRGNPAAPLSGGLPANPNSNLPGTGAAAPGYPGSDSSLVDAQTPGGSTKFNSNAGQDRSRSGLPLAGAGNAPANRAGAGGLPRTDNTPGVNPLPGTENWSPNGGLQIADRRANNGYPTGAPRAGAGASYDPRVPPSLGASALSQARGPSPNFGSAPGSAAGAGYGGEDYGQAQIDPRTGRPYAGRQPAYGSPPYPQTGAPGSNLAYDANRSGGPGYQATPPQGYPNAGYGNGTYGNAPNQLAGTGAPPIGRVADRGGVGAAGAPASTNPPTTPDPSASDNQNSAGSEGGTNTTGSPARSNELWLQIFFLVSLIVNFYLGMLIRKLLTRYRSLLSSVRGQAA